MPGRCGTSHKPNTMFKSLSLIYMLLRVACAQLPALSCSSGNVRYASSKLPFVAGGVMESCKEGCQARHDDWSKACELTNKRPDILTVRKCQPAQTQAVLEQLLKDGNGAMLAFTPCQLHSYLRGRTLWLIGDSLMKNFYYALRCFMLDFWDHSLGECQVSHSSNTERAIYHAADTNLSSSLGSRIVPDLPRCIQLVAGGRVCHLSSVRGEELADPDPQDPGLLQTLYASVAQQQDIFYVNFGRWHFTNCHGLQLEPYQLALRQLGKLFAKTSRQFPNLFFKVSSHDHSACRDRHRQQQARQQCLPAQSGGYPLSLGWQVMHVAESILSRYNVPVVNTYNQTKALYLGHITDRPDPGREVDCTHYCSPGEPEFELWSMFKALKQYKVAPVAEAMQAAHVAPAVAEAQLAAPMRDHGPPCVPVTAYEPPSGWSYYQDSLRKQVGSQAAAAARSSIVDGQNWGLWPSTCTGAAC